MGCSILEVSYHCDGTDQFNLADLVRYPQGRTFMTEHYYSVEVAGMQPDLSYEIDETFFYAQERQY